VVFLYKTCIGGTILYKYVFSVRASLTEVLNKTSLNIGLKPIKQYPIMNLFYKKCVK
jgi:hypothetical protein